jgi:hypothetical protein
MQAMAVGADGDPALGVRVVAHTRPPRFLGGTEDELALLFGEVGAAAEEHGGEEQQEPEAGYL